MGAAIGVLSNGLPTPQRWNEDYVYRGAIDGERASERIAQSLLEAQMDAKNRHLYEVRVAEHRVSQQRGDVVEWSTEPAVVSYPSAGVAPEVRDELRTLLEDPRQWNSAGQGAFVVGEGGRYRVEMSSLPVAKVSEMPVQTTYGGSRDATRTAENGTERGRGVTVHGTAGPLSVDGSMSETESRKRSTTDAAGGSITHTVNHMSEVETVRLMVQIEDTKTHVRTTVLLDDPPVEVLHNTNRPAAGRQ